MLFVGEWTRQYGRPISMKEHNKIIKIDNNEYNKNNIYEDNKRVTHIFVELLPLV